MLWDFVDKKVQYIAFLEIAFNAFSIPQEVQLFYHFALLFFCRPQLEFNVWIFIPCLHTERPFVKW